MKEFRWCITSRKRYLKGPSGDDDPEAATPLRVLGRSGVSACVTSVTQGQPNPWNRDRGVSGTLMVLVESVALSSDGLAVGSLSV